MGWGQWSGLGVFAERGSIMGCGQDGWPRAFETATVE